MSHLLDRRAAFRHTVAALVGGNAATGQVTDLSTHGLYFLTDARPQLGAQLDLVITLPHASPAGPLTCAVTARVVRVEPAQGRMGVAVEIEEWRMAQSERLC